MTGSLSKSPSDRTDAPSEQWTRLVEAAERRSGLGKAQPVGWWNAQAETLSGAWLATGLPTTRLENWKYTSLAALHAKSRDVEMAPIDVKAPAGVRVLRLSQFAENTPDERALIQSILESKSDVFFENLAKSFVIDPTVVLVPAKLKSETPIEVSWGGLPEGRWGFGLAVIVVGDGADVSVVERYGAGCDAQTVATWLELAPHACAAHLRIQAGDNKTESGFIFASARARVSKGAKYESSQVSFGSTLSREDLTVELVDEEAETITDGVFIGRGRQLLDHHTNLVHRVGSTTSRQIYKGILADESRGVFNGRIAIAKNAKGSNSSQMNKNLLLSKKVELDTKPQLEIDNDDVKAAHGAAIGRLDADHIFYLRSRGIEMGQAVEMLARGFAYEAIQRLSSSNLREIGVAEIERGLRGLAWEAL